MKSSPETSSDTVAMGNPADHSPAVRHHPLGFWFFFWGEFAERCSFYGMKAILPLYLTGVLEMSDTSAGRIQSLFKMAAYCLPLVGGYLADRFFGKYWTIVGFSLPYVLGHFILGIPNITAVAIALALLAGGSGVIKPNVSTLMGLTYDQKRPGQKQLRAAAFMWFYFSINIGSVISSAALPYLRNEWGYAMAFQFPAWLMVAALFVFALGKPYYAVETIQRRRTTPEERREQWATLRPLFTIFLLIVFFWIAYEQNDTLWIYFVRDYVDLRLPLFDTTIKSDQLQFINPLLVVIFVPTFNGLFKLLDPQSRVITATRRMLTGFALTAVATGLMSAAGYLAIATESKVSVMWYIGAFSTLTIGEILIYGTGLELAYALAPERMKGFVTACFLLTVAIANLINTQLFQLYGGSLIDSPERRGPLSPGDYFAMSTLMMVLATIGFYFIGRRFDRRPQTDVKESTG